MSRNTQTTYTSTDENFDYCDDGSQQFAIGDVQKLAKAVLNHDHSTGKGLAAQRVHASQTAGDVFYAHDADSIDRVPIGTAYQVMRVKSDASGWEAGVVDGSVVTYAPQLIDEETMADDTAAMVTFSDIPQTFKHLKIVIAGWILSSSDTSSISVQINDDTGANYSDAYYLMDETGRQIINSGHAGATQAVIGELAATGDHATEPVWGQAEVLVGGYTNTTGFKTMTGHSVCSATTSSGYPIRAFESAQWANATPAALTKIKLLAGNGSTEYFGAGTTISLFGLP